MFTDCIGVVRTIYGRFYDFTNALSTHSLFTDPKFCRRAPFFRMHEYFTRPVRLCPEQLHAVTRNVRVPYEVERNTQRALLGWNARTVPRCHSFRPKPTKTVPQTGAPQVVSAFALSFTLQVAHSENGECVTGTPPRPSCSLKQANTAERTVTKFKIVTTVSPRTVPVRAPCEITFKHAIHLSSPLPPFPTFQHSRTTPSWAFATLPNYAVRHLGVRHCGHWHKPRCLGDVRCIWNDDRFLRCHGVSESAPPNFPLLGMLRKAQRRHGRDSPIYCAHCHAVVGSPPSNFPPLGVLYEAQWWGNRDFRAYRAGCHIVTWSPQSKFPTLGMLREARRCTNRVGHLFRVCVVRFWRDIQLQHSACASGSSATTCSPSTASAMVYQDWEGIAANQRPLTDFLGFLGIKRLL